MLTSTIVFEKVEHYGVDIVSDKEILVALTGIKEETARKMLDECGSFIRVCENSPYFKPLLTKRQFQKLTLLNELIRRKPLSIHKGKKINEPKCIAEILIDLIGYEDIEYFYIVMLNTKNRIIKIKNISLGDLNSTIVHPREVFAEAIKYRAASIILAHNHPSKDTRPSNNDIMITKRLIETGKIIGIEVLDHIIIGGNEFRSLKKEEDV